MYKWWIGISIFLLIVLQYKLWVGDGSIADITALKRQILQQEQENAELAKRNQVLEAEVKDLKSGLDAIEEQARERLGMIKQGETFYRIIVKPTAEANNTVVPTQ